jgi:PAS domain S-box-containing protein
VYEQTNLLLQLGFEQAPIGMMYTSLDGHILQVNKQFCSIVGYSCEELIGRPYTDITPPEDAKIIQAHIAKRLAGVPEPFPDERRYIRKDGETIWIKTTPTVLHLPSSHEPLGFVLLVEDITERRRAEVEQKRLLEFERAAGDAERQQKEETTALVDQLRAIFEAMTDGVIFCDVEGKILLINATGYRLLELGSEIDITGEHHQILLPLVKAYDEHRRPLSTEQLPINRILRGEVLSSEQVEGVFVRLLSGREMHLGISGAPVYDSQGHMIGGVYVFRDITESRQRERRVQQALNALLTIVEKVSRLPMQADGSTDTAPVSLLHTIGYRLTKIIRQVLRCHFVACSSINPQTGNFQVVGVSGLSATEESIYRKEAEHSSIFDYLEEEDVARLRANEVLIRDLVTHPYMRPRSDFGIRYRLLAPMLLGGQLVGLLVIGEIGSDLTYTQEEIALVKALAKLILQVIERARLTNEWAVARANELALSEASRRFDSFLSIASHELRTPLTTIKGNVQLALRRMETFKSQYIHQFATLDRSEQITLALEKIHKPLLQAVHRTRVQERMIGDLLDASRIRANKLELVIQPCDLVEIVQQMVEDLQYFASDRLVRMHLPETEPIPLMADADRIGQVINNYLINAIRYSAAEQPVDITVEIIERGKMARVMVQDQGPGIAPQDLEHIWERFYRSHDTQAQYHAGAGLGLGLYISRTIVERHSGQVGVESIQDQGSTFWFTLPIAKPEDDVQVEI